MNNLRTAILRTGTLSALAGLALLGSAQAGTETFTHNVTLTTTEIHQTFTLPQFDPSLGILDSVTLSLDANGNFTGSVKNGAAQTQAFTLNEDSKVTLTGPDATGTSGHLTASQDYVLASGATAAFGPFAPVLAPVTTSVPSADFADFTGLGTLSFGFNTLTGTSTTGAGGNITTNYTTLVGGDAAVTYNYHTPTTNPTPEPGAWASMSIGVLGLLALGLKARKKNLQF